MPASVLLVRAGSLYEGLIEGSHQDGLAHGC